MAIDERDATMLGLLTRRNEAKRRKAVLESELRTAGKSLHDIGGVLRYLNGASARSRTDYILQKLSHVPAICDLGGMRQMLEELKDLETRLAQLKHSTSQTGID